MTMTVEKAQALLDGATPGPWLANGEPWNLIVWSAADNRVCFMAHSNGLDDDRDVATAELVAAAPDLARAYIAQAARIEAADKLLSAANASLMAEIDDNTDIMAKLSDPVAVHANMLRGTIAKPTVEQIIHLYGVDTLCKSLAQRIVREAEVRDE